MRLRPSPSAPLNPSLNWQSFCRGKVAELVVPNLVGAFIPASRLVRDREWRFWGDANGSEPTPATQASAISLAVVGHRSNCAFLTGIGAGNVSATGIRGTADSGLPRWMLGLPEFQMTCNFARHRIEMASPELASARAALRWA